MVLGEMFARNARKFQEKLAVVSGEISLTYKVLNERINRLANGLLDNGLKKGDRLAVLMHNCHQFIEVYFAAAKIGAIFCPFNNHLRKLELIDICNYSKPKFLIADIDYGNMVGSIKPDLKSVETYICLQKPKWAFMKNYEEIIIENDPSEPDVAIEEDDVISIFFTGGTTGKPKGAMRTHRHLVSDAVARVIELKVEYDDRPLISFPMYHVACEDNIVGHFFMPNTMHIKREGGFNPAELLSYISRNHITVCQMVPTMLHAVLQAFDGASYDLSSLRLIVYGGSSMPVELLKRALETLKCGFLQVYGQTESGPLTTVLKPEDHILDGSGKKLQRLASAGRAVINYEIKIVDDDDNEVPMGEIGEIACKSEAIMKGYWESPGETEKKLKGGWLHTGDLGKMDEDGYVYIVDRKNDMVISGGVNIYPREVEEVLYAHPAILEAQVIGVKDEYWGEALKAVVVLKEGMTATADEIIRFCGERLASFKKPKSVEFWKELPKSPQGKILKRVIREAFNGMRECQSIDDNISQKIASKT